VADKTQLRRQFSDEQEWFVEMLRALDPEMWSTPSLCEGWNVRDVVLHTAWHIHLSPIELLKSVPDTFRSKGKIAKFNALLWDRCAQLSTDSLTEWLASPAQVNQNNLGELIVHQQDIRRPLGLRRTIPSDRLSWILGYCSTPLGGGFRGLGSSSYQLGQGISFTATDVAWSSGSGPEVRGPGEAILMAINGRLQALEDLDGTGVDLIKRRIEALTPSKFIALSPRLPSHLRRAPGPSDGHGASVRGRRRRTSGLITYRPQGRTADLAHVHALEARSDTLGSRHGGAAYQDQNPTPSHTRLRLCR
jgi:uncharacterized protein (TIGR03083 family)